MTIIVKCPRCGGFVTDKVAKALKDSPAVFKGMEESMHHAASLEDLLLRYNRQYSYIELMYHISINCEPDEGMLSTLVMIIEKAVLDLPLKGD